MKKIKFLIITIYLLGILLISGFTIFLIVTNIHQATSLYFQQEKHSQEIKLPFQENEVNKLIDDLKKYKFIE